MCNTWRNVFLQSMKNNTLSVKKLMKNLILRTLRQLYAVSEIIILIRWVTPPQKVENLQFEFFLSFEILQFLKFFNFAKSSLFPSFFFIGYIYIYEFMSSTAFTYSYFFKLFFLLSEIPQGSSGQIPQNLFFLKNLLRTHMTSPNSSHLYSVHRYSCLLLNH